MNNSSAVFFLFVGNGKSSSGLLEFSSVPSAVEALILANHYTMQREAITGKITS
jgi:hypothetical protein